YKFFVSEVEKYRFLATKMLEASNEKFILLYHFENTRSEMEQLLTAAKVDFNTDRNSGARILVLDAEEFLSNEIYGTPEVFVIEIYPLAERDSIIVQKAQDKRLELNCYASIDSPFFQLFGGERVTNLIHKMGVEPGEVIEHSFINTAIIKAQQKIAKNLGVEQLVRASLEEWMKENNVAISK
ncbi:MAG: hypothetical protein NXI00_23645, partial [Cytophagales bacterium]|nr:hypothetical protein [Cytophagales bacterium]